MRMCCSPASTANTSVTMPLSALCCWFAAYSPMSSGLSCVCHSSAAISLDVNTTPCTSAQLHRHRRLRVWLGYRRCNVHSQQTCMLRTDIGTALRCALVWCTPRCFADGESSLCKPWAPPHRSPWRLQLHTPDPVDVYSSVELTVVVVWLSGSLQCAVVATLVVATTGPTSCWSYFLTDKVLCLQISAKSIYCMFSYVSMLLVCLYSACCCETHLGIFRWTAA